jgi:dolichyl-phosphate-mannose-protein mannosyltransferase
LNRVGWVAPVVILAFAGVLRFWALGRPDSLVFDELYYVRDAISQLAHGFPTTWPNDDPSFTGDNSQSFNAAPNSIAHPPLGKWLIGVGVLLFGSDTGWGWRFAVAAAGVATVGMTMRLSHVLTRSMWVACLAGLLLAIDGVHVVLSRVALLDGLLTLFVVLGALCIAHDWRYMQRTLKTRLVRWWRPWMLAAAVAFGAATAVKWSGLYAFAAFLVATTLGDLVFRASREHRPWFGAGLQAFATACIALPVAFVTYLVSWLGWILAPGGQFRSPDTSWWESLWRWHAHSFSWHSTLDAAHPYEASALTWPLGLRPTAMYFSLDDTQAAAITPLPNVLVTWGGALALLLLVWVVLRSSWAALRARNTRPLMTSTVAVSTFVLTGYLSGWLPWVLTFSRSAVFQFYAVVLTPFAAIALALALTALAGVAGQQRLFGVAGLKLHGSAPAVHGRRLAVALYVGVAVLLSVMFWPLWIGMPVEFWFYQWHLWLPGWA